MTDDAVRRRARFVAVTVLFRAFPWRTTRLALLVTTIGIIPALFAILVGRLVGDLPGAIRGGFDSDDGRGVVLTLVWMGVVLVAQELVAAIREVYWNDLYRRFDEHLVARVMDVALGRPDLALVEDPRLAGTLDRAARVTEFGPGELVSGLSAQWAQKAQGLAATVLVAYYEPIGAAILLVLWVIVSGRLRSNYYRADPFWTDPLRRARYIYRLALLPQWAKEVRIFGLPDWLVDQFGREWTRVMRELWSARRAGRAVMSGLAVLILLANAGVAGFVGDRALDGALSIAALTVVVQGLLGMACLASQDGDVWIENGAVPMPDVLALEQAATTQPAARTGTTPADGRPKDTIRFEGVRFAYPSRETPVYEGFDLEITAGTSLAVVGLNGAGKTTLVKLLTGLVHPQGGRITVDDRPLDDLDLTSWRRSVAAIFQDFVHYEMSARDNIGFGAVEHSPSDDRVHAVAAKAGAAEIVAKLPRGLDTPLSRQFTGGVDLSGGEWQRFALARALMAVEHGAQVLVLDEPTAHLDVRAEVALFDRFLELTAGLTTILISHRFSTVRRADRIVVLDGGRVTEDGTHESLLAAGGRYATMFRLQADRYGDA